MEIGNQMNFIVINKQARPLYSLIADGQYRAISLGRNTWNTLIGSQASLQQKCNKEGFNAAGTYTGVMIGILGFGGGLAVASGNVAKHGGDHGDKHIEAMGYILVQWQEFFTIPGPAKRALNSLGTLLSERYIVVKPWSRLAHSCRSLSPVSVAWSG